MSSAVPFSLIKVRAVFAFSAVEAFYVLPVTGLKEGRVSMGTTFPKASKVVAVRPPVGGGTSTAVVPVVVHMGRGVGRPAARTSGSGILKVGKGSRRLAAGKVKVHVVTASAVV